VPVDGGRRPRKGGVVGRLHGAAGGLDHGRVARQTCVERPQQTVEPAVAGPRDPERVGHAADLLEIRRVGVRHGPQETDAAVQHELRRGDPGQQRDLGVPVLDREAGLEPQAVPRGAVVGDDLLPRRVDSQRLAAILEGDPQAARPPRAAGGPPPRPPRT
jgi:hypothetical protein